MNVNKVIIAGALVNDPELRRTKNGTAVSTVVLEVKREWVKDDQPKEEVSQIEVDVFGKTAELLNQYLKQGDPVLFEGHLKLERWEADGQQQQRLIVVAEQMNFISTKEGGNGGGAYGRRSQATGQRPQE